MHTDKHRDEYIVHTLVQNGFGVSNILLTGPKNRQTIKVKSMSIILLINSTLYPGSVFLEELINLIYENLLVIEYQNTALWFNESTESIGIWYFVLCSFKNLKYLLRLKRLKIYSLNVTFSFSACVAALSGNACET